MLKVSSRWSSSAVGSEDKIEASPFAIADGTIPGRDVSVEEAVIAWLDTSEDDGDRHGDWIGRLGEWPASCGV